MGRDLTRNRSKSKTLVLEDVSKQVNRVRRRNQNRQVSVIGLTSEEVNSEGIRVHIRQGSSQWIA